MKKILIKIMNRTTLDCHQATFLIAKQLNGQLGFTEKLRLKSHLAYCKFCENFNIESKKIDKILKANPDDLPISSHYKQTLTTEIKEKIKQKITENE
jgi:hypothetical protein